MSRPRVDCGAIAGSGDDTSDKANRDLELRAIAIRSGETRVSHRERLAADAADSRVHPTDVVASRSAEQRTPTQRR